MPTGTNFTTGKKLTLPDKIAEKLSENIRKINRAIAERKFYVCKFFH